MYTYNLEKIVHMWPLVNKKSHRVSIYGDFEYKIWWCPRLYLEKNRLKIQWNIFKKQNFKTIYFLKLTVGRNTPSWNECIRVSSKSSTNVLRFTIPEWKKDIKNTANNFIIFGYIGSSIFIRTLVSLSTMKQLANLSTTY